MRLFRQPPLGVCAVEFMTRRQCARLSDVSMSLDGASPHKVWIAMMRKVAQPERFLPEGMPVSVELHAPAGSGPTWRCLTFTRQ